MALRQNKRSSSLSFHRVSSTKKLDSIAETQENGAETASYILDLILTETMTQIKKIYIANQTIRFTVHCAHQALEKLLTFHHYRHNNYLTFQNDQLPNWTSDLSIPPSHPDSWAVNQIPICQQSHHAELITLSDEEIEKCLSRDETSAETTSVAMATEKSTLSDADFSVTNVIDHIIDEISVFSRDETADGGDTLGPYRSMLLGNIDGDLYGTHATLSKLSPPQSILKLPPIELPDSNRSHNRNLIKTDRCLDMETTLPPIRTDAKYMYRAMKYEEPSKKDKKKKQE